MKLNINEYLEVILKHKCIFPNSKGLFGEVKTLGQLSDFIQEHSIEPDYPIWDYPVEEIDYINENGLSVALVCDEKECRYFETPFN